MSRRVHHSLVDFPRAHRQVSMRTETDPMKIPGAFEAMQNLAGWASRQRWKSEFGEAIRARLEPPCEAGEIDLEQLDTVIGEEHAMNIHSWAFEDFATERVGPKRRNLVDDYLGQRAHREPISARD